MLSEPTLRPEQVRPILTPFGAKLSDHQIAAFSKYLDLIIRWNGVVSLTAVSDPEEIVERHFGESIFAASLVPLQGRLADVGSGAGFPGVPLKILAPEMEVLLLEPNLKKSAFLIEVCAALDLKRVKVTRSRYEDENLRLELFDIITSRALGDYKRMLRWARPALKNGGRLVLWLGEQDATALAKVAGWNWSLPVRIPGSRRRVLLTGQTQL
jgi:16S rRNA (guanine527-N7)-methyltransferase